MMYILRIFQIYCSLLVLVTVLGNDIEAYCGASTYGSPLVQDCSVLLESFASHLDTDIRVFDEEQHRTDKYGSWLGLEEPAQRHAVQLPRYYTLGKSLQPGPFEKV